MNFFYSIIPIGNNVVNSILATILSIKDSIFKSILPIQDKTEIQLYLDQNIFPSILDLISGSILYMAIYSILRILFDYFTNEYVNKILKINIINKTHFTNITTYLLVQRKNGIQIKKREKFQEAVWRFFIYSQLTIVGGLCIFYPETQKWVLNTKYFWIGYPYHNLSKIMIFYKKLQIGSYFHQLLWIDNHRSNYLEMTVHHLITIILIMISYSIHFHYAGIFTSFIHDISDIFLESAKFINYSAKANNSILLKNVTDILFVMFAIVFSFTRLYIFPFWIIRSLIFELRPMFSQEWNGYFILIIFAIILQLLHIYWFYLIIRMVYKLFTSGIDKDERSDDEEEEE